MATIRDERTGTEELLRDGRYHYAALLADPEAAHLSPAVKTRLEALQQAMTATEDVELLRLEKQALADRAEYLHDNLHRDLELQVLAAVKKNRAAAAYRAVYPQGFSALIALSGEEQEHAVGSMLKGLGQEHPSLAKTYEKDLTKLATEATKAEKQLRKTDAELAHAFSAEVLARSELVRQLRRNEGALLSLFPDDKARTRLYFRSQARRRPKDDAEPAPTPG